MNGFEMREVNLTVIGSKQWEPLRVGNTKFNLNKIS